MDSVVVAHECIHSRFLSLMSGIHSRFLSRESGVVCKLDFQKAYDRVDWSFLVYVLQQMGCGDQWRNLIHSCVTSVHLSVLVNGSPKRFFPEWRRESGNGILYLRTSMLIVVDAKL